MPFLQPIEGLALLSESNIMWPSHQLGTNFGREWVSMIEHPLRASGLLPHAVGVSEWLCPIHGTVVITSAFELQRCDPES